MKLKLDENLPSELCKDLIDLGHDAESVVEEGLAGASDSVVLQAALREERVLFTLDKGIADLRDRPRERSAGVVLFRPDANGRAEILGFIRQRLPEILALDLVGRLVIVSATRIRVR